jgi:hypothetical protein
MIRYSAAVFNWALATGRGYDCGGCASRGCLPRSTGYGIGSRTDGLHVQRLRLMRPAVKLGRNGLAVESCRRSGGGSGVSLCSWDDEVSAGRSCTRSGGVSGVSLCEGNDLGPSVGLSEMSLTDFLRCGQCAGGEGVAVPAAVVLVSAVIVAHVEL